MRAIANDPEFVAEFEYELKHYVGRPEPDLPRQALVASISAARRSISSAKI